MNVQRSMAFPTSQVAQTQRPTDTGIRLPYYYSSCSLEGVVEIVPCEEPECGRRTIIGLLLEYADGHHERVGQFRFDWATEALRVEHASTLNIGVKKSTWFFVADIRTDMTDEQKEEGKPKKAEPKEKPDGDESVKEVDATEEGEDNEEEKAKEDYDSLGYPEQGAPDWLDVPLKGFLEWWFSCNSCKIYYNGVIDPDHFGGEDSSSSGSSSSSSQIIVDDD